MCGLPVKRALGIGFKRAVKRLKNLPAGSARAAKLVRGAVALDVVLNLGFEAALFANCFERAHSKWKAGEITTEEYHRRVIQSLCECTAGFLVGTGGSYLGQVAIPVPILGSIVGCTLGSLIGRWVGSIAGKKISDRFIDKGQILLEEMAFILQNDLDTNVISGVK